MRRDLIRRRNVIGAMSAVAVGFAGRSAAQAPDQALVSSLTPVTGRVRIDALHMSLTPPAGLGYLNAQQTRFLFTAIYHNPESDVGDVFGCVLPLPPRPGSPGSFEVVIRAASGRIADTGPGSSLDPTAVKRGFLARIAAINAARPSGEPRFEKADIVVPARYDPARHVMTVGRSFQWSDEPQPSVNLDVFLLTRKGTVILTATSPIDTLKKLEEAAQGVVDSISFDPLDDYDAGKAEPRSALTLDALAETLGG